MIPPAIAAAADEHGWRFHSAIQKTRLRWITLGRDDISIYIWRDRWRHTSARAYRGSALSAIFTTQHDIIDYLETAS